jgi:hypothetical protein
LIPFGGLGVFGGSTKAWQIKKYGHGGTAQVAFGFDLLGRSFSFFFFLFITSVFLPYQIASYFSFFFLLLHFCLVLHHHFA